MSSSFFNAWTLPRRVVLLRRQRNVELPVHNFTLPIQANKVLRFVTPSPLRQVESVDDFEVFSVREGTRVFQAFFAPPSREAMMANLQETEVMYDSSDDDDVVKQDISFLGAAPPDHGDKPNVFTPVHETNNNVFDPAEQLQAGGSVETANSVEATNSA